MSHTFIPVAPSSLATEAYGHFLSTLFPLPTSQQKALCLPKGLTTPWPEPEEKGPPFPCLSTWATSELFPCYSLLERMSNIFMVYFFFRLGGERWICPPETLCQLPWQRQLTTWAVISVSYLDIRQIHARQITSFSNENSASWFLFKSLYNSSVSSSSTL